jgi:hypothetical protein
MPKLEILNGVACTSAARCIAVGASAGALAERWNGTAWTRLATVDPRGSTGSDFTGISCANATTCMALAESWNGSTWTLLATPASSADFASVSCGSATSCLAVGPGFGGELTAAAWDGSAWTPLTVAAPPAQSPVLGGVSCTSPTSCLAVGSSDLGGSLFAERWSGGTSLSLVKMPSPDRADYTLSAIAWVGILGWQPSSSVNGGQVAMSASW